MPIWSKPGSPPFKSYRIRLDASSNGLDYTVKIESYCALRISIVIPALNEKNALGALLGRLAVTPGVDEVVVADGGSSDGTSDLAEPPIRLVRSEAGRGIQLRAGAEKATGDVLLFLHADVVPPKDLAAQITGAISEGSVGGNFRLRYPDGGLLGRWLEILGPVNRRQNRYYGDSGLFVRRDAYEALGGFPAIPIMEDVVFVERMERYGRTAYLPGPMVSSGRRWKGHALRTLLLWGFMQAAFALGASPWRLDRFYHSAKR
ncbi:MAG TPA: TIGR04283 family arsenosugar biosynthesis glycosyltransferase [Rubrobacteraceae bacterium]|nr:TIGR04283 family arsenosugar biosynthesis glycosyltransferase [Rubrobacteraceae bacterium]